MQMHLMTDECVSASINLYVSNRNPKDGALCEETVIPTCSFQVSLCENGKINMTCEKDTSSSCSTMHSLLHCM